MKKIKKVLIALLIVLLALALVITLTVTFFVGWDNFFAAVKGITVSEEQLEVDIDNNLRDQQNTIKDLGFNISEEDMGKIVSGELDDEEKIVEKLLGKHEEPETTDTESGDENDKNESDNIENVKPTQTQTKPKNDSKNNTSSTNKKNDAPEKKDTPNVNKNSSSVTTSGTEKNTSSSNNNDERIAELIAKMYVYKSQYTGKISSIVSSMCAEYDKLPKEQLGYSAKVSIYNRYSGQIATMEAQCDAQVNAIVSEMRTLLKESDKDQSLADSLVSAYNAEKENTKAYYVNKYAH